MLKYRPDIDGLRAFAILPVILFHADVPFFSGGFVGVDIFFVISGYLIGSILLRAFAKQEFSIYEFYVRRARRILPALAVVVTVSLVAGFFLLLPSELEQLAKAAKKIAVFFSNHFFLQVQEDYWQQNTLTNQPLLHTWSLAIEEQFYFFIPLILLFCFKFKKQLYVLPTFLLLTVLSIIFSQYLLDSNPAASFYLLPSRAFELLIGVVLAIMVTRGNGYGLLVNQFVGIIGFCFILISVFFYHSKLAFPGLAALLPCLGAAAVIYSGSVRNDANISWINKFLSNRLLVFVGLISYSLYLWHWPILVFGRSAGWYAWGLPDLPLWFLLLLIFWVSWATWLWIECPFRGKKIKFSNIRKNNFAKDISIGHIALPCKYGLAPFAVLCVLVFFGGYAIEKNIDFQPVQTALAEFDKATKITPGIKCEGKTDLTAIRNGTSGCVFGKQEFSNVPEFIVLGDSHARMWADGLEALANEQQKPVMLLAWSSCTPLLGYVPPSRKECVAILEAAFEYLEKTPIPNVVLAGYWVGALRNMDEQGDDDFYDALKRTVKNIKKHNKYVYIMHDIPELDSEISLKKKFVEALRTQGPVGFDLELHKINQYEIYKAMERLQDQMEVIILSPDSFICQSHDPCVIANKRRLFYRDTHHLTDYAAYAFRHVFLPLFMDE